jgi:hypothetical protein
MESLSLKESEFESLPWDVETSVRLSCDVDWNSIQVREDLQEKITITRIAMRTQTSIKELMNPRKSRAI